MCITYKGDKAQEYKEKLPTHDRAQLDEGLNLNFWQTIFCAVHGNPLSDVHIVEDAAGIFRLEVAELLQAEVLKGSKVPIVSLH